MRARAERAAEVLLNDEAKGGEQWAVEQPERALGEVYVRVRPKHLRTKAAPEDTLPSGSPTTTTNNRNNTPATPQLARRVCTE